ncbi:hypothetical protein BCON_0279g00090 [Botryotinia convoluta]|uniref:Uncharacterized protein n=1 Tax=Botryotinia convoluta TaxID=54673 RepID=A0A4Z1HKW1_9HELO|nr:hypothetical protein BCON_0279g00090 [Botryotinia convoluta]
MAPCCRRESLVNSSKNFEEEISQSSITLSHNGNLLLLRAIRRKSPSKAVRIETQSTAPYFDTERYLPAVTLQ